MTEGPILSPDGKHVLVNGEWLELSQQNVSLTDSVISGDVSMSSTVNINTNDPLAEIKNLAEFCVLKLSNGDMSSAKESFTDAKKINVKIALEVFENQYAIKIGMGYLEIVEYYFSEILAFDLGLEEIPGAGQFGDAISREVRKRCQKLLPFNSQLMIAARNAIAFLGKPKEIKDNVSDFIESSVDPEEQMAQIYRLGFLCQAAGQLINKKLNEPYIRMNNAGNMQSLLDIKERGRETMTYGALMRYQLIEVLEDTCEDPDSEIELLHQRFSVISKIADDSSDYSEDYAIKKRAYDESMKIQNCFVATAAYGTPFAKEIDILRMWRDNKLQSSFLGRNFVKIYYSFLGPFLARIISKSVILKYITRQLLKPVVYIVGKGKEEELRMWLIRRSDFD